MKKKTIKEKSSMLIVITIISFGLYSCHPDCKCSNSCDCEKGECNCTEVNACSDECNCNKEKGNLSVLYSVSCTNIFLEYATPEISYTNAKGDTQTYQIKPEELKKGEERSFYGDASKKEITFTWEMPSPISFGEVKNIDHHFSLRAVPKPKASKVKWKDNADSLTYCGLDASCVIKRKLHQNIEIPPKFVAQFSYSSSGKEASVEEFLKSFKTEINISYDSEGQLYWKHETQKNGSSTSIDSGGNLISQ